MPYLDARLVTVDEFFPKDWEVQYEYRALEIKGRSRPLAGLDDWHDNEVQDYRKILKAAKLVGAGRPVKNPDYVKPDEKKSGIFEMRAPKGSARLLFYYATTYRGSPKKGVVILLDYYWKTKSSKKEQERSFQRARLLREMAEQYLEELYKNAFGSGPIV